MIVIGLDPGAKTGVAICRDGKLTHLDTIAPMDFGVFLDNRPSFNCLVVLEDSTLISHIYTAPGVSHAAALKVARNVGEIDAWCKLIKAICAEQGIPYRSVSPKDKGAKLNAEKFKAITGWEGKSNQHERDAAMVAWRFRNQR